MKRILLNACRCETQILRTTRPDWMRSLLPWLRLYKCSGCQSVFPARPARVERLNVLRAMTRMIARLDRAVRRPEHRC
jgi:hypothetical protein